MLIMPRRNRRLARSAARDVLRQATRPVFEQLEQRRLLSGDVANYPQAIETFPPFHTP